MKKITSLFLSLIMLISVMSIGFSAYADTYEYHNYDGHFRYEYLSDGTISIKSVMINGTVENSPTTYVIPSSINGATVTTIGENAFSSSSNSITTVIIPSTVTNISNHAFSNAKALKSITIPNSVTSLGEYAFSSCTNLTSVSIGSGIKTISKSAFQSCTSLKSVKIPNTVTKIGEGAFGSCSNLSSVSFGSGVKTICESAFNYTNLSTVSLPVSLTSLSTNAFYSPSLKTVKIYNPTLKLNYDHPGYFNNGKLSQSPITIYGYRNSTTNKFCTNFKSWGYWKFKSLLSTPSITSISSRTKGFYVKWGKKSVTGYQVQYSRYSNFSSAKTVTVSNASTVSKTVSGLTKKKKYYVRVRTYKTVKSTRYYSAWSSKKAVTTK